MNYHNGGYYIKESRWDEFLSCCKEFGFSHGKRYGVHPDIFRSAGKNGTLRIDTDEDSSFYREICFYPFDGRGYISQSETRQLAADLIEHDFVELYVSVGSRGFKTNGFIKCENERF
jgi:hypothetical protein